MSLTRILAAPLLVGVVGVVGVGLAGPASADGGRHVAIAIYTNPVPFLPSLFYTTASDASREEAINTAGNGCAAAHGDGACHVIAVTDGCLAVATKGVGYQWGAGAGRAEAIGNALHNANTGGTGSSSMLPLPAAVAIERCANTAPN